MHRHYTALHRPSPTPVPLDSMNLIIQGTQPDSRDTSRPSRQTFAEQAARADRRPRLSIDRSPAPPRHCILLHGEPAGLRLRAARPQACGFRSRGDGHGFDADHDRVHRRDRRHAGAQTRRSRRSPKQRCAARSTLPKVCAAASRCWQGLDEHALQRVYDERLQLSSRRRDHAGQH